ncbi:MAG: DUF6259 domain-containing protein [Abditibacteriales bacterium]|nr:DUF6259 domain-containing protein [Abditibacteriales bacterium]MDW8366195.1 DUF6259 domain-containing protein [Abditibacteriales bacterium]
MFYKSLCLASLYVMISLLNTAEPPLSVLIVVKGSPGVVTVPVDFARLARALGTKIDAASLSLRAAMEERNGAQRLIPCQFDADAGAPLKGTLSLLLPPSTEMRRVRLYLSGAPSLTPTQPERPVRAQTENGRVVVSNEYYAVTHDPTKMGGLPSRIEFKGTGKVFNTFNLNDRVHDPQRGSFLLRHDASPKVEVLARGPLRAVVRVRARYAQTDGKPPPSQPEATYIFSYYAGSPLVRVEAEVRQREAFHWQELHFIEINFPDQSFSSWATGEPLRSGQLQAQKQSYLGNSWGALTEGNSVLGLLSGEAVRIYDGRGEYGTYLHGPWVTWEETERRFSATLWLGSALEGAQAVQKAAQNAGATEAYMTVPPLEERLMQVRQGIAKLPRGARRGRFAWVLAHIERHKRAGELREAIKFAEGLLRGLQSGKDAKEAVPWLGVRKAFHPIPVHAAASPSLTLVDNGRIGLGLAGGANGFNLVSLFDLHAEREFLSEKPVPLWRMELRGESGESLTVDSTQGWNTVLIRQTGMGKNNVGLVLRWEGRSDARLRPLRIECSVALQGARASWELHVENPSTLWSIWRVRFPQVALGRIGNSELDDRLVFPRGSGELVEAPLTKPVHFVTLYPNGWGTMQFYAQYDNDCGVYVAMHDPLGGTKDLHVEHEAGANAIICGFDVPAENMGIAGNDFHTPGAAVIETFRGDWFDAAQIYKRWVEKEAKWNPDAPHASRNTPRWMRDLPLWALTGGTAQEVVGPVKAFAEFMGVPVAVHWYNWHQIPFDNDYPHYFPTKPGFAEGVRELQQAGVRVMPYINGRLWDTRDKGTGDDQFTRVALPAATKDEKGKPYEETYGSKEADGSPVRLAVMCPTTPLWQQKVKEIVLRLMSDEVGVDGVYIDQVAAAAPRLCFDQSHGHPLGGGQWWTKDGYWKMLTDLRADMQRRHPEKMLTTECNAEPFTHLFDGYLTWHWQYQNQIPLFSAVYGGKVQLFGRAYRGGATKDLALRMKAAQSLVFGEQIGWIDPNVYKDPIGGAFIRRMARLRYALKDYLAVGDMARPPQLRGDIPQVTADWQWSGEWIVTTDALLSGAWRAKDGRVALIFVNVTDKELSAELVFDGEKYGFKKGAPLRVTPRTEDGTQPPTTEPTSFRRRITLPAYQALALEVQRK